jgi:pimeloyl-ACP methyl ester carboxylesterase
VTRHRAAPSSDLDNAGAVLTRAWPAPSRTARAYTGTSGSFAPDVSLDPRVLGALATLAALLSGAVGAAADPTASVAPLSSPLHWHICDAYNESFLCSELAVPIDYARPADGNLKLALVERPANDAPALGDIVMNPGGPGDSGVHYLEADSYIFPAELTDHFNLVSFDPRGVGQSDPVACEGASALVHNVLNFDPDPVTAAQASTLVSGEKAFARSCVEHTSMTLLDNVGTADTVRDLDRIRAALGQSKLNYLGLGYGTYLGELYDERTRATSGPWCSTELWTPRSPAAQAHSNGHKPFKANLGISSLGVTATHWAGSRPLGRAGRHCPKGPGRLTTSSCPGWPTATGQMRSCRPWTARRRK